jgi:guanylate kinase
MNTEPEKKIIILTAPSGAGKTTIKTRLLKEMADQLSFSVSATTRTIRAGEVDGVDYIFLAESAFKNNIESNQFIEWEMVYPGMYYGTSVEEIHRIWEEGKTPLLDIEQRLVRRGTDNAENITMRVNKSRDEMQYKNSFDKVILNDDIEKATAETAAIVKQFIGLK